MLFQVEQDRSIALAFAERKIVDAQHAGRHNGWLGELAYEAQQRIAAGGHMQALAGSSASRTAPGQSEMLERLLQAQRALGIGLKKIVQALGKGDGCTVWIVTAKAPYVEQQPNALITEG